MALPPEQDVEFPALDGTILRGCLYPSSVRGPGIVMSPGFNCLKEMLGLPDVASAFQSYGYTCLLYDPRTTGSSDGQPRNDIDPILQVGDYSDAISFLSAQASVDPAQIYLWGMSFAAAVALCAASTDKRAKGVIAICPLTNFTLTPETLPKAMKKCMQDRASQVLGNDPFYVPMLNEKGENPMGFGVGIDSEKYQKIVEAGKEIAPGHVNRTTIQSYYKLVMWQPFSLWKLVDPTPVLFIVPELDRLSPKCRQIAHFEDLKGPKRLHIEGGVGHMDICEGPHVEQLMARQHQFLTDIPLGNIE